MAVLASSGTKTSDGTEQLLATVTNDRTYWLLVARTNQDGGDTLTLTAKIKGASADTAQVFQKASWVGAPDDTAGNETKVSLDLVPSPVSASFYLTATAGDDYAWWIYEL